MPDALYQQSTRSSQTVENTKIEIGNAHSELGQFLVLTYRLLVRMTRASAIEALGVNCERDVHKTTQRNEKSESHEIAAALSSAFVCGETYP
jgi:hypothetical protein